MNQDHGNMKKIFIPNRFDNREIPVVIFESKNAKKSLLLFHGIGTGKYEYLDFYKMIGESLSAKGINVISFDSRTHGESKAELSEFTLSNLIGDGIDVIQWIQETYPDKKLDLLGTSFGAISAICLANILTNSVRKVFLLAPVLDFNKLYFNPPNPERAKKYQGLLAKTLSDGKYFPVTENQSFNRNMIIEFSLLSLPQLVSKTNLEFEVMHGDSDTMVPYSTSEDLNQNTKNVLLHCFDNMDHGFTDINDDEGTGEKSLSNFERILSILNNN